MSTPESVPWLALSGWYMIAALAFLMGRQLSRRGLRPVPRRRVLGLLPLSLGSAMLAAFVYRPEWVAEHDGPIFAGLFGALISPFVVKMFDVTPYDQRRREQQ